MRETRQLVQTIVDGELIIDGELVEGDDAIGGGGDPGVDDDVWAGTKTDEPLGRRRIWRRGRRRRRPRRQTELGEASTSFSALATRGPPVQSLSTTTTTRAAARENEAARRRGRRGGRGRQGVHPGERDGLGAGGKAALKLDMRLVDGGGIVGSVL